MQRQLTSHTVKASAASARKTPRQPVTSAIKMPAGTPSTNEPLIPMNIIPIARPCMLSSTSSVASIVASRHTVALAAAIPVRVRSMIAKFGLAAAAKVLSMKRPSAARNKRLRSIRFVRTSARGAVIAKTMEKTAVS